ncbi:MAG: plasmid recombination protein, partial [Clostridium sp.]|nr:plasmid recombination protein [Clostridium sp.]
MAVKTISFPKGKGHLTHNNRDFICNNVAPERTAWNRTYIQESLRDAYEKCFGQSLRDYNAAQKRKDRQKDDYLKEIENSGNGEKAFYENVVQIGKMTDTPVADENGNLTEDAKAAIAVLDQYAKTFQERNPNLYLFNCVMHLDEATPHLHIDYIPVAHGYKNGMETRNSLTKAFQQMGFAKAVSRKQNETVAWQERERAYLMDLCREQGIEIEVLGIQRDNLSLPEYKAAMREVEELEQQAAALDQQNEALERQNDNLEQKASELHGQVQEMESQNNELVLQAQKLTEQIEETEAKEKAA